MRFLTIISDFLIPTLFAAIVLYGVYKKVNVYDAFIEGAQNGFKIVVKILPTLLGLMLAVGILRAGGVLDLFTKVVAPLAKAIGYPVEAVPLTFMRLVSSSASTGLLLDTFKEFGPDSFIGRFVSVMMSCTETVFYTMSIYFISVKVTKTKYTLAGALIANFAGVFASLLITAATFGTP